VNLSDRLAQVWARQAGENILDLYDRQRRTVTLESVQTQPIQNKRDLEAADPEAQAEFRDRLRSISADAAKTREFLTRISMVASLRRAAALN
jgi:3-(3-hydroxy-phenyl)propionate hydroxylase